MTAAARGYAAASHLGKRRFRQPVELAASGVSLDLGVKLRRVELLEPAAETGKLVGRKIGDGVFDIVNGAHE